ncbi:MAG: hypothetical protein IJ055_06780 [Oscillospiraceae bacterium]|nr:hypothetical protein [Oscillospiraceae bacterium]
MDFYMMSLLFVTGAFLVAIWLKELLQLLLDLTLAPLFSYRVKMVSFFGLRFECDTDGHWERRPFKYSQLITDLVTADLRGGVPEHLERKEKTMLLLRCMVLLLCSALLLVLTWGSVSALIGRRGNYPDAFLAGLSVGFAIHSLSSLGTFIYIYAVLMKRLGGYVSTLLKRIRQGERVSEMQLLPVESLPYQKTSKLERMQYYNIYLMYLLEHGDIAGMRAPIREMADYYRGREFLSQETLGYYWLIFYYSRYELDQRAATFFLDKVRHAITSDPDANAKRVLAYYAFGIERNNARAQQLVHEGLACVDRFSLPGEERELERQLLLELQGFLDKAAQQGVRA